MFWKRRSLTFKERVDRFWNWFPTVAERFYQTIEDGNCERLQHEIGKQAADLWDEFQWVFGPGPMHRGGHSFTLSGGGYRHAQFLAAYWVDRAPEVAGWTFYGSRQPGDLSESMSIGVGEQRFEIGGLWLAPELDEERQVVHVNVWHPTFCEAEPDTRNMVLFLILDEVLGEFGTDQWLGAVDIVEHKPSDAIPASQLRDYLHDLEIQHGWQKLPPTESYTSYRLDPSADYPRSDTIVGTTANFRLIEDYLDAQGPLDEDPLEGSGAEFAYVKFPSRLLPPGEEANFRRDFEQQLEAAIGTGGRVLGGAIGTDSTYVDLLLLDGSRTLDAIRSTARQLLSGPARIEYFTNKNGEIC
ncbi:MAG: hypothetical protein KDB14_22335 [Planctomycetales bacterium]|nr:hypothetical protein [Planctomycetales bacterium]